MQSFKKVEEFYSNNSARRRSPEADSGQSRLIIFLKFV